ncbi:MAG TPA: metallophosphoesterase [Candidatus Spyradocola merdavium]|nr:metallophosphoesterase [Candidatus Spyradocola merdavium]
MRALVLAALALAVLAALLLAGNAWANARVWNARVEIRDEKIPAAFDGFVLCQVSDVHNEARGEGNAALLRALREAAPDLICITGDFLDSRRTDLDFALELAGQLAEIAPAVYVTGNHEARLKDLSALEAGLAARGVQVLRDDWMPLARGGEEIALLGLDDPGFAAGEDWTLAEGLDQTQARLSALLAQAGDRFSLVLSHRPELLPAYAEAGADLVLSGHAHGGQVRLPGIGGLFAPGQGILPRLTSGVHARGETRLVVSRGLGNSAFPLRVFNPPEIVTVTLRAGAEGEG